METISSVFTLDYVLPQDEDTVLNLAFDAMDFQHCGLACIDDVRAAIELQIPKQASYSEFDLLCVAENIWHFNN